jgi:hypothetical protein
MLKRILIVLALSSVLLISGCSAIPNLPASATSPSYQIVRKSDVGGKWQMYQLKIELGKGDELPILLKLADGDKVDGYFDVEKGEGFDFQIAGNTQLYKLEPPAAGKKVSDRFSFTASQSQGNMYILTLRNTNGGDKDVRISAFLEVVFPASGAIFIPLDTRK